MCSSCGDIYTVFVVMGLLKKNTNKNVMYSLYMNVSTGNLNFWIEMLLPASACYVYYRIKET